MATYTPSLRQNLSFLNTLQLVKPESLEDTVQPVWQGIVLEWFLGRDGYKWDFKASTVANNNMLNVTVIQVTALAQNPLQVQSTEWTERQILLVQCKRPSSDRDDTITSQFKDDLSQTLNSSERLFEAVAIGKKVRFYRFDGRAANNQNLVQLHQGTFDMDNPNGIVQVENMMNYVKANGWQWASS
ncbi:hypothetical protein ASPWEDRAFT_35244 [Aspergillus wentii DTO 134E9]|uniref:Fungal-type protein kinase domain-containing protein n=1 Tax=Aspergillus wentii DTO 134E9 TaxID=1073089 RepID=A0A1L9S3C1_ASPWE|nr:uncharacterized protein ASPWEDRAFT_35244 [Aspergillus wentii DTO 134E9]KAI9929995.1 hypothetical protein MW887_011805 [Aspergillus wentii]OJJ41650.1 hypothetical protein ASPWEDRAFT_35244 [Aspergillus wentii DTO 134E9]